MQRRPAVLRLDDGRHAEMPDWTVGDAHAFVALARETGDLIGGEIDPSRVVDIGRWADEEEAS
jgi:hypothetical protein